MLKLEALKDFKGAEDGINIVEYKKGEIFETTNKEYYDNLIKGKLAKDATNNHEKKVVKPNEVKNRVIIWH